MSTSIDDLTKYEAGLLVAHGTERLIGRSCRPKAGSHQMSETVSA